MGCYYGALLKCVNSSYQEEEIIVCSENIFGALSTLF